MERILKATLAGGAFQDGTPGNSRRMSAIRAKGNKSTEARLRAALVRRGVRGWQLRPRGLPGNPDFLFPAEKVVVFVDGCFWHGCPRCGHAVKKNGAYWKLKVRRNRLRDARNGRKLRALGLVVLRFWEHALTGPLDPCMRRIRDALRRAGG
jgi:DNA mismatch endonuclease (patch repair protein)